jgi:hypothetical protein
MTGTGFWPRLRVDERKNSTPKGRRTCLTPPALLEADPPGLSANIGTGGHGPDRGV